MRRSALYSLLRKGSGLVPEGWHAASGTEACALRGCSTAAKPITATLFPGDGVFNLCDLIYFLLNYVMKWIPGVIVTEFS